MSSLLASGPKLLSSQRPSRVSPLRSFIAVTAVRLAPPVIPHFPAGQRRTHAGSALALLTSPVDGPGPGTVHSAAAALPGAPVAAAQKPFLAWRAGPVKDREQPVFRFRPPAGQDLAEHSALIASESGRTEAGLRKGREVVEHATSFPPLLRGERLEGSARVDRISMPMPRKPFAFGGGNDSRFGAGDLTGRDGVAFRTRTRKVTRKWSAAAARTGLS